MRQMVGWLRAVSWLSRFTIGRRERRCVAHEGLGWWYILNITYINCCCAVHALTQRICARERTCVYRRPRARGRELVSRHLLYRGSNRSNAVARTAVAARTCLCMRKRKWDNKTDHPRTRILIPYRREDAPMILRIAANYVYSRFAISWIAIRNNSWKFVVCYYRSSAYYSRFVIRHRFSEYNLSWYFIKRLDRRFCLISINHEWRCFYFTFLLADMIHKDT